MKKDILVINPESNVAVSTLWSKKELVLQAIGENLKDRISIIGTTYTSYGINYIFDTLAQYPRIDTLILYGLDLSTSGETLLNVFGRKQIDDPIIILNKTEIDDIVKSVKLIDLRSDAIKGDVNKLIEEITKNYQEKQKLKRKKLNLKLEEKSTIKSYPLPLSGHYIYDNKSVFRTWVKILDLIMRFGNLKFSEYGIVQKEYLNLVVTLGLYGEKYELEEEFFEFIEKGNFEKHVKQIFNPQKPKAVDYTYGERFFNHRSGKNQIDYIIKKLSQAPYSRRALAVSWDHSKDQNIESPPCIIGVQGIITENFYNHTVVIRSNDMFKAWPVNFVAQIELAEYILNEINTKARTDFKLGNITSISVSAHIYQTDFERASKILEKYAYKIREFIDDPKGNFLIYIENQKVILEQRTPDNSLILFKNEFEDFKQAYNFLKNNNMFSFASHAAYLSKEIKNAFEKLKKREEYGQDSES
jgi:thymidylate synthase